MIIIPSEKCLWQETVGCYRYMLEKRNLAGYKGIRDCALEEVTDWDPKIDRRSLGKFVTQDKERA